MNVHTKFGDNPLIFTQVIIWKQNKDGEMTDRNMDIQYEPILPYLFVLQDIKSNIYSIRNQMMTPKWKPFQKF